MEGAAAMLPRLLSLKIQECQSLADGALQSVGSYLTALTSLELHRNSKMTDTGAPQCNAGLCPLPDLRKLPL